MKLHFILASLYIHNVANFSRICNVNFYIFIDEPEIQVEKAWVHADVGIEAEISCIVHAVPSAEVRIKTYISNFLSFLTISPPTLLFAIFMFTSYMYFQCTC